MNDVPNENGHNPYLVLRNIILENFGEDLAPADDAQLDYIGEDTVDEVRQIVVHQLTEVPFLSISKILKSEAKTLRQRAFTRMLNGFTPPDMLGITSSWRMRNLHTRKYKVQPKYMTLRSLLAACRRNTKLRKVLSSISITSGPISEYADLEVVPALQDLADIVAWEAGQAFEADYYPGIPDMDSIPDDHVTAVMKALQREMDREGASRVKQPPIFIELPRNRQVALAERRRYWFGKFGISPESWKSGVWSLWKVSNEPFPEWIKRYDG